MATSPNAPTPAQQATRAKILAVAERLFHERGVHAVGVNDIAAEAQVSKVTLYRFFPSKDDLVRTVATDRSARVHDWIRAADDVATSPRERILALFDLHAGWFARPDFTGCAIVGAASDTRDTGLATPIARRHLARLRHTVEGLLFDLGSDEPARLARQVVLLLEGATIVAAIDADASPAQDARMVVEALLDGATGPR